MGSSKLTPPPKQQQYRDDPRTASSSAVSLHSIEEPEDAPPPYTDEVGDRLQQEHASQGPAAGLQPYGLPPHSIYGDFNTHPPLPSSRSDTTNTTTWTYDPSFSTNPVVLEHMIKAQSRFPPFYSLNIRGTHHQTVRSGNSDKRESVIDFDFTIDLTDLLSPVIGRSTPFDGRLQVVPPTVRAYRGGILPSRMPNAIETHDVEHGLADRQALELQSWCELFCADPARWKSFTFRRHIVGFDEERLRQLVVSAVQRTGYQGHMSVSFDETQRDIVFYSPGRINNLRTIVWVRWLFYLSFLWVLAWPVLFLLTRKWEVVHAEFRTRDARGRAAVRDEGEWFADWESAVQRAAYGRVKGCVDDTYRRDTLAADARAQREGRGGQINTGNAAIDGLVGFVGMGVEFLNARDQSRGWGRDC
ncbi:hypothetical protein CAC42_4800 [Sphaceloma murrayae]|uniref:Uncharacterized protein n=1 Tax=Sphaceloma murrayae TaxID=2082308 RepID=A0A2K1QP03_9PEZI|nr:hypothetical protein CAC42_4800 [Sphaceloma murrayae]